MKTKFRILVFVSLLIIFVLESVAVAAAPEVPKDPREGVSSAELAESGEIVVAPLLGEYSWDQSLLSDDQIQLPGIRYYNRFMDFEINGKTYAAGCGPVAIGQVMHYLAQGGMIRKPSGSSHFDIISKDIVTSKKVKLRVPRDFRGSQKIPGADYNLNLMPTRPIYTSLTSNGQLTTDGEVYSQETSAFLHDIALALQAVCMPASPDIGTGDTGSRIQDLPPIISNFGFAQAVYLNLTQSVFLLRSYITWKQEYDDILVSNLNAGLPVLLELKTIKTLKKNDHSFEVKSTGHILVIDGYGYLGDKKYYHLNLGGGGLNRKNNSAWDTWYDLSLGRMVFNQERTGWLGPDSWTANYNLALGYNILSDDLNGRKELATGRIFFGNKPYHNAKIEAENTMHYQETFIFLLKLETRTNSKGIFAFRVFPRSRLSNMTIEGSTIKKGSLHSLLRSNFEDYQMIGESISHQGLEISEKRNDSIGNKNFENIVFDTAHIMGSAQGIENGIGSQFNYPLPFNSPKNAAEWDFTGLSALYMDPLNYGYFTSQPWLDPLYRKIKQFVMDGGTIYITADSNLFVQSLGSAAGVGLQFFTKTQVPVYYGDAGLNKILLHGALRENIGVDELVIPFMPYEDGSGGPVFKSIGSATPLAAAEIVLSDGTRMRYPVTVYKL